MDGWRGFEVDEGQDKLGEARGEFAVRLYQDRADPFSFQYEPDSDDSSDDSSSSDSETEEEDEGEEEEEEGSATELEDDEEGGVQRGSKRKNGRNSEPGKRKKGRKSDDQDKVSGIWESVRMKTDVGIQPRRLTTAARRLHAERVQRYYHAGTSFGLSVAECCYLLASELERGDNDLLW